MGEDDGVKVVYKLNIKMNKEVEDKIKWLTNNFKDEISAFLTGEINENEIIIDGLLFPHQDVSSGSVEVEPKDLIKLRKEYGNECTRIIGHWHSHNTMSAFWSAVDDKFIEEYSITKDVCLFLVTSTTGKRLMVVNNKPFRVELDNLEYSIINDDNKMVEEMQDVIDKKVICAPIITDTNVNKKYKWEDSWNRNNMEEYNRSEYEEDEENVGLKVKECLNWDKESKSVIVSELTIGQAEELIRTDLKHYPKTMPEMDKKYGSFRVIYKMEKGINLKELLIEIKRILEELFIIEESDKRALKNSGNPYGRGSYDEYNEYNGYGGYSC